MPCYSCSSEFGFLKREVGCDVCGFSFCSRCCKKKEVPSEEGEVKKHVCNKCYENLTSDQVKTSSASPPLAHKKRMALLKKQSYSVDSGSDIPLHQSQWSCDKDKEIAERLQRLKRDRIKDVLPSEDDIAERLAKLKGIEPSKYKAPPIEVYRPPDIRTSVERAADLMKQVTLEVELDSRLVKPEDEIATRLAHLRDEAPEASKDAVRNLPEADFPNWKREQHSEEMDIDQANLELLKEHTSISGIASRDLTSLMSDPEYKALMLNISKDKGIVEKGDDDDDDDDDDENKANKLVEKLLAADVDAEELDSLQDDSEESNSKSEKDTTEEFPWCVLCTEDAKIRCFDCDSDIYCMRCFKESHDGLDIKGHRTCPYLPEKNSAM